MQAAGTAGTRFETALLLRKLCLMPGTYDVIVIGVGAMGASACFHLASGNAHVLGLEQFDIPHSLGSSHGHSRMIRMAYYEKPAYVPLLRRSYKLWDELEQQTGRKLLYRTGGIFLGPRQGVLVNGAAEAAAAHGLRIELLSADEVRKRWPQFVVPADWHAIFDPEAGFLRPENAISAYAVAAMYAGAELHGQETVLDWSAGESQAIVRTDRGQYTARRLIFTGGAWSGKLLGTLGLDLKITRQVTGWVWPRQPRRFELGQLPVWAIDAEEQGGIYYGFPMIPQAPGFKLGHHCATTAAIDPQSVNRSPVSGDEESFRPALTRHIPDADGPLLSMRVCLYTNTPDEDFIVDVHPRYPIVQFACGFSGHGFKFASVIGEILASRALGNASSPDANFLRNRQHQR